MALEILAKKGDGTISLDLFGDDTIDINYSIANIRDISNTTGSYTKTITIPDTPKNRQVFGYITDLAVDNEYNYSKSVKWSYDPNLKVKCWVLDDTVVVLEGYIQITRYNISESNHNKTIECTVYADNANFYIQMGDKLLTDIDFSEYNFTLTPSGITASWTNNPNAYTRGYYFPFIDYGRGWTLNDLQDLSIYNLNVKDFLPAIYVKTIWDKIFQSNGYTYKSNFLGSPTGLTSSAPDVRFGNLVIPYYQQTFQNSTLFNQDKIFHVGLYYPVGAGTWSFGTYAGKYYSPSSTYPKQIVNMVGGFFNNPRNIWYNGYILNPYDYDSTRNTALNDTYTTFQYATTTIPFSLTASPMFNTYVNGGPTFKTSGLITDVAYQNRTTEKFKQRFVLKTDVLTTYSNQWNKVRAATGFGATGSAAQSYNYIMKVEFFRECDPVTGLTSSAWATGTGVQIPADLGPLGTTYSGAYKIAKKVDGSPDYRTHWITDIYGKSNCFTSDGTLIVPTGTNRFIGKYRTNPDGTLVLNADDTNYKFPNWTGAGADFLEPESGQAISWFYNDAFNQGSDYLKGLWCSGYGIGGFQPGGQATFHPAYGDWFQQLQLQTIFLDGDTTNKWYGDGGIIAPNGNRPIYPGERVRCVVTFGSKYKGQQRTSTLSSYKPPSVAYLLTSSYFYQNAGGLDNVYWIPESNPLTQFYNDVQPDYITGQTVDFNTLIPKNIKQRDFIQDIIRMHNLYVEPDRSDKGQNCLIIEPRDQYYALGTASLDWREKLDVSNPVKVQVLAETQYKRTRFTYKADNDYYNKAYTNNTNEVYGQFINVLDNEFLTDELKIESMFSPTPMTQLYSYYGESGGDTLIRTGGFVLPVLVSGTNMKSSSNAGPNGNITTNYRILYKRVIANQNAEQIYMFGKLTNVYPYAGPYDNPYDPSYSINWGQTLGEFFPTPTDQFSDNLVNTYWSSLLTELGDADSRLVTCYMFLQPDDINQFYFYKQVLLTIDGVDGYYKVNSIENYMPGQNTLCKVTLLKSKINLPIKKFWGSTSITPPGSILVLPIGGGGAIPGPSPSA